MLNPVVNTLGVYKLDADIKDVIYEVRLVAWLPYASTSEADDANVAASTWSVDDVLHSGGLQRSWAIFAMTYKANYNRAALHQ